MLSISRDSQPRPTFAQSLIKLWSARYLHFAATRTANALLAYASAARQLAIVYRHCQPARGSRFPGLAPFLFLLLRPSSLMLASPSLVAQSSRCLFLPLSASHWLLRWLQPPFHPTLSCFDSLLPLSIRASDTRRRLWRRTPTPRTRPRLKLDLRCKEMLVHIFVTVKYCWHSGH